MDALPLAGRVAIVTGAGRGIGRAIALAFAAEGAAVALAARSRAELAEVAGEIRTAGGGRALAIPTDVTNDGAVEALEPRGVAVVMEAIHTCMLIRGVEKQNSKAVTSAMLGAFRDRPETRAEFMELIKGGRGLQI